MNNRCQKFETPSLYNYTPVFCTVRFVYIVIERDLERVQHRGEELNYTVGLTPSIRTIGDMPCLGDAKVEQSPDFLVHFWVGTRTLESIFQRYF